MRVLLVSSSSGSRGGGEIYLRHLASGLSRLGHRIDVLCDTAAAMDELAESLAPHANVMRVPIVNTYRRPTRPLGAALAFRQQRTLGRLFGELSPDLIHVNQQVAEDGLDLLLAARRTGIPLVSTIHIPHSAKWLGARAGSLRDVVTGAVLRRVSAPHIVVAERAKVILRRRFGFLQADDVRVVLNGVSFAEPDPDARTATRARWGVKPHEVVLGTVGRLDAQKDPEFTLRLISALRRQGLAVRFIWIGDGPMRNDVQALKQTLGIAEFVLIDGWRADVPACLQGLDIFAMPSRFEGMPLALLEALGANLCCFVSDVDGFNEAIESGKTGFVCKRGDLQDWCAKVEPAVLDAKLRGEIGSRAAVLARKRFSIDTMAQNTLRLYKDVLLARGRNG